MRRHGKCKEIIKGSAEGEVCSLIEKQSHVKLLHFEGDKVQKDIENTG